MRYNGCHLKVLLANSYSESFLELPRKSAESIDFFSPDLQTHETWKSCLNVLYKIILNFPSYKISDQLKSHWSAHWMKSVRIWSFCGPYLIQMRENTDQKISEYRHFSRCGWRYQEDSKWRKFRMFTYLFAQFLFEEFCIFHWSEHDVIAHLRFITWFLYLEKYRHFTWFPGVKMRYFSQCFKTENLNKIKPPFKKHHFIIGFIFIIASWYH